MEARLLERTRGHLGKTYGYYIDLFWSKVSKGDAAECWEWNGKKDRNGYGTCDVLSQQYSHRVAFVLAKGDIPKKMVVMHMCDNRSCCNPSHLKLGTQVENIQDCKAKGRNARGESHIKAKLTEADVLTIRKKYRAGTTIRAMLGDYSVCYRVLWCAASGRTWKHL